MIVLTAYLYTYMYKTLTICVYVVCTTQLKPYCVICARVCALFSALSFSLVRTGYMHDTHRHIQGQMGISDDRQQLECRRVAGQSIQSNCAHGLGRQRCRRVLLNRSEFDAADNDDELMQQLTEDNAKCCCCC